MADEEQDDELAFGQGLVEKGLVTPEQVQECMRLQSQLAAQGTTPIPTLGQLLIRKGYLTTSQIQATIRMSDRSTARLTKPTQPAAARTPAPIGKRFGKFIKSLKLGEGGMGEVWKAWDTELGRWIALKFLHARNADEIARFRREAQTAARLSHPGIAAIYEAGEDYIAMQYVDGETMSEFPRTDLRRIIDLVRQAAVAAHYAHENGILHRDLKPANIMVGKDGRVVILDFGLAKPMNVESTVSASGTAIGTPNYMSPEQAQGVAQPDRRSDVFSLGATLYHLITGVPPFDDQHVPAILVKIVETDPKPVRARKPEIPEDLETVVMKCMEKDPNRRYATAQELADDLGRWLGGEPIHAHAPSSFHKFRKKIARNPWAWGLAAAVVALAIAGGLAVEFLVRRAKREKSAGDLVRRIERLYEAGDYAGVEKLLREAPPNDPEARYWRARLSIRRYQSLRGVPEARVVRGVVEVVPARPETEAERRLRIDAEVALRAMKNHPMAEGLLALWARRWDEALKRFRAVPRDAPGAWEAEFYAGMALYLSGSFDQARDLLTRHRSRDPGVTLPVWIRTLLALGQQMDREGGDSSGVYLQAQAACQELGGPRALLLEAQILVALGISEAAVGKDPEERYARAIEKLKGIDEGESHVVRGDAFLARAEYRKSRGKLDFEDPVEYREAIEAYGKSSYGVAYLRRAEAYLARREFMSDGGRGRPEDLERAREDYEKALAENPKYLDASIGLAYVKRAIRHGLAESLEALDEEIGALGRLLEDHPRDPAVWRARGLAHQTKGAERRAVGIDPVKDFDAALDDFSQAIAINGRDAVACVFRGRVRQNLGLVRMLQGKDAVPDFEAGIADFTRALQVNPKSEEALLSRGIIKHNLGFFREHRGEDPARDYAAAMEDFRKAIDVNPLSAVSWFERGRAKQNLAAHHIDRGRGSIEEFEDALRDFDRAIEINPGNPVFYRERGRARQNMAAIRPDPTADLKLAIEDLGRALRIDPRNSDTLQTRGTVHMNLAVFVRRTGGEPTPEYEAAIADFGRAIGVNPNYPDAWRGRGLAYQNLAFYLADKRKDPTDAFGRAIADFTRAVELNPKDAQAFRGRGLARFNLAWYREERNEEPDFRAAIDDLSSAIEINAGDPEAWLLRGQARVKLARRTADPAARSALARDAVADLKKAAELNPEFGPTAEAWLKDARALEGP